MALPKKDDNLDTTLPEVMDPVPPETPPADPEPVVDPEPDNGKIDLKAILAMPEMKDFIARVRKQEKDKLYPDLQRRDNRILELEEQLKELRASQEGFDKEADKARVKMEGEVTKLRDDLQALQSALQAKDVALYREQCLKAAGDEIIEELVVGNTPEEIDAAIEVAKAKYKELLDKMSAKHPAPQTPQNPPKKPAAPPPTNPPVPPAAKPLSASEIRTLNMEDYARNREALKRQALAGLSQDK